MDGARRGAILLLSGLLCTWPASVSALDLVGTAVTVDFAGFTGMGFDPAPSAGQLDSDDWVVRGVSDGDLPFGGSGATGDYARGPSAGYVFVGGVYGFDVSNGGQADRALGLQPTGADFTPGAYVLRIVNQTGAVLDEVRVGYEVWVHNSGFRSSSMGLSWSLDDVTYTAEPSTVVETPTTPDFPAQWEVTPVTVDLLDLKLQPGEALYLRFETDDASATGLHDELALDDVTIEVLAACGNGIVEADEECDDGNLDDGDGCARDCTPEGTTDTSTDDGTDGGNDEGTTGDDGTSGSTTGPGGDGGDVGLTTGPASGDAGSATDDGATASHGTTEGVDTTPTSTAGATEGTEDTDDGGGASAGILDDDGCGCGRSTGSGWAALVLLLAAGRRCRTRRARAISRRSSTPHGP